MRSRRIQIATTAVAAVALLLTACADNGADDDAAPDAPQDAEDPGDLDELDDLDVEELEDLLGGQGDLPNPNEQVEDGEFRGEGIVLPVPEEFELDPAAFMQGLIAAVTDDGSRQIAGQAVDTDTLPEPLDLEQLVDANSQQFGEPDLDEAVDVDGAAEARQLRFDTLPSQQEGQPDLTLLLIVADNGEGRLAVFNYVAPADEYDDEQAQTILSGAGFDPDSAPEPVPTPAPAP